MTSEIRLSFPRAREVVLSSVLPMGEEGVSFSSALGRVTARDIKTGRPFPRHNLAAKDGYAISSKEAIPARPKQTIRLKVTSTLYAGDYTRRRVGPGEAVRVMTGAILPPGADVVIPKEDAKEKEGYVELPGAKVPGVNIKWRGQNLASGEIIVSRGVSLEAEHIGLLASLGKQEVKVFKRPRVAIIVLGDELVPLGEKLAPGKEIASNVYLLSALVSEAGGQPFVAGLMPDDLPRIEQALLAGLKADMIVSSGGVSLGERDLTGAAIEEVGGKIRYRQVAMSPGHRHIFAWMRGKPVFALPGAPPAVRVVFEELVRPAIRKMSGYATWLQPLLKAALLEDVVGHRGETDFKAARAFFRQGEILVRPLPSWQKAAQLGPEGRQAFIVLSPKQSGARRGDMVMIELLS